MTASQQPWEQATAQELQRLLPLLARCQPAGALVGQGQQIADPDQWQRSLYQRLAQTTSGRPRARRDRPYLLRELARVLQQPEHADWCQQADRWLAQERAAGRLHPLPINTTQHTGNKEGSDGNQHTDRTDDGRLPAGRPADRQPDAGRLADGRSGTRPLW